jgi:hypothetical protein
MNPNESKDPKEKEGQESKPKYLSIEWLRETFELTKSYYTNEHRRLRLLDATDRADIWKALGAKFPKYQILPDTNFVSYVKTNILASIYTVAKSADILPTSEDDKEICAHLNIAIDRVWDLCNVGYFQFQAGERAALCNLGITQVGWSEELTGGNANSFYKGNVTLKNVNPMKFMRDPFAPDLETSSHCIYYDSFHRSVFLENPNYRPKFRTIEAKLKGSTPDPLPSYKFEKPKGATKDYYNLIIFWVKDGTKIHEIHTIDLKEILYYKLDIKPSMFPFAELYCNLPAGALIGTSEPAKIFANNVAFNLMDSIALTAEYKNQHPPKFISSQAGLNVRAFAKHGDEADRTFIVNGLGKDAVYYHQFPNVSPQLPQLKQALQYAIEGVTGVDGRYTGRDTGSIITTGGTEEMLNRVTIIDSPKILNYEMYTKRLTQLILANLINFAPKRKYFYRKPNTTKWETIEVDFPKIDNDTLFNYSIEISSRLPKNKQRIAAMANMLMEKQMQYQQEGASVQLITEEEWLLFQDLPYKEFLLERMGIQRQTDALQEVSQVLFQYSELVKNGVSPEEAILATAESLKQSRRGELPGAGTIPAVASENIGPVPQGGGMMPGLM